MVRQKIWLDCDPGHDDAIALLMALYQPDAIELLGVSTVNGNAPLVHTHANAAQLLKLFGAPSDLPLYRGRDKPLVKPSIPAPASIHGHSGLDGVVGMPPMSDPDVSAWHDREGDSQDASVEALRKLLTSPDLDGEMITLVITGPATNVGALRQLYPDVYENGRLEKCVIMGGAFDIPQWTPYAEFNVATDPDALAELLESPNVPVVLVPLNITHQAIFKQEYQARLLDPAANWRSGDPLPQARSTLRESLSTMLTFFRQTYIDEFGFHDGPPIHDAVCIQYLTNPQDVQGRWAHVQVCTDLASERNGETTAHFFSEELERWQDRDRYASGHVPRANCYVAERLAADRFFENLLRCVDRAEQRLPNANQKTDS